MKKFLTVLLVIAVMFTFSFGSAFADVTTGLSDAQQAKYDAAVGPSNAILIAKFDTAWAKITTHELSEGTAQYTVTPKAYAELKESAYKAVTDALYEAAKVENSDLDAMLTTDAILTTVDTELKAEIAQAQFVIDYAKEVAKLDTVDTSVYAKQAAAEEKIAEVKASAAAIANKIDSDSTMTDCVLAWIDVNNLISNDLGIAGVTPTIKKVFYQIENETVFSGLYELADTTTWKKVATSEAEKAAEAAQKAALKAVVAQNVAEYQLSAGVKADATLIAAYTEGYGVAIDEKIVTNASAIAPVAAFDPVTGTYKELVGNYNKIQELVAYADKYKAEKDADGNLVRDAEAIDDIVDDAKKAAYADSAKAWNGLDAAKREIAGSTIDSQAKGLAYVKENAKTLAKNFVDDNSYYPAEQTKVDEILAEFNAKVDAAEKTDDITKATGLYATYMAKLDAVKTKSDVKTDLHAKSAYKNAEEALKKYVEYYNGTVDAGKKLDEAAIKDLLDKFYGENGARTEAAMKALKDSIIGLVENLPTAEAQATAKKAAIDAINAIPAAVTLADEAAIQAAVDAVDAYDDVYGTDLPQSSKDTLASAKAALGTAYKVELYKKAASVDKTDKAAVKAMIAEFDAADDNDCVSGMNLDTNSVYKSLKNALDTIRTAEKNAVVKAINAIPVNVTEADKAQIEAARALYDAYVDEYTDYTCGTWGVDGAGKLNCNAANDFADIYRELALAEAALGLNAEDPAYSVEALKITAGSTAKKGSITVKWTVKGDTSAVEGWEIWKSTKRSSGYSKAFTQVAEKQTYKNTKGLKKGTRYYYKVRAIAYTADGTKVKSDWSNKAYRIAK